MNTATHRKEYIENISKKKQNSEVIIKIATNI